MIRLKYIVAVMMLLSSYLVRSQASEQFVRTKDSLMLLPNDSVKVDALLKFCKEYGNTEFIATMEFSKQIFKLTTELKLLKKKAKLYNILGDILFNKANYKESFHYYYAGYKLADSIHSKFYVAVSAYNLGWQAALQQKNYKDVSYIYESLKIGNELNSNGVILRAQNALGSFYTDKYNREKKKADFDSAVKYFSSAIEISKSIKAFGSMGPLYSNMGQLFYYSKDYKSSIFYYDESIRMFNDSNSIVSSILKVGVSKLALKKPDEAIAIFNFVYNYLKRYDIPELRKDCLESMLQYYREIKDPKRVFEVQKEYTIVNDKLNRELHAFTISNMDTEYDYAKSEANNIQLKQAGEIQELKNKRQTIFIYVFAFFGGVIIVIAFLLFKQSKLKQRTSLLLQTYHKTIVEKTNEIEQSIEYAKGIQTSFLPDTKRLNEILPANFIFYLPKDIVSGDFYWFEVSRNKKQLLIACADSTGHGVPGSLLSMVGINMLQQLSGGEKLNSPGAILKNLNNKIIDALKQNAENVKQRDGMDIALIHIDLTTKILTYSGANRPLYLVKNNNLIEVKASKHAIGGYTMYNQTFEEASIEISKEDFICLSTDGYADQFGGPDGKKLMTKKLKDLIISVSQLGPEDQLSTLQDAFNKWKGEHAQVDDVCLIGLKV